MHMQFLLSDLQNLNTLRLPAKARLAVLSNMDQVRQLPGLNQPLFFLGGGSNVVMQENISHYVVRVALMGKTLLRETSDYFLIQANAGENWHDFVAYCLQQGWPGLENLALIPGTVGAAPVQNIGAYGVELDQLLHSVIAFNLVENKTYELSRNDCGFAYRDSMFKSSGYGNWLILKVNFILPKAWKAKIDYPDLQQYDLLQGGRIDPLMVFNAVCKIRQNKLPDPLVEPNAGSFFKNPVITRDKAEKLLNKYPNLRYFNMPDGTVKLAAAWLIDQAGWRGKTIGSLGMHNKQALVMVNHGNANASDVLSLAKHIKNDVKNKFNVNLEQEPVVLN